MLDTGEYAVLTELAKAGKINRSYLNRVMRLTLLAPEITESILDGRQGPETTLDRLMQPFPVDWLTQGRDFGQRFGTDIPMVCNDFALAQLR